MSPHRSLDFWSAEQTGVYIASCYAGAPCRLDELEPRHRVVAVNEQSVNNIDELYALFEKLEGPLRFRVVDLKGRA